MNTFSELLKNPKVKDEYEKAFWLKQFRVLYDRMSKEDNFRLYIMQLYRESHNPKETTKIVVQRELGLTVNDYYAQEMSRWMKASFMKKSSRDNISLSEKKRLYELQSGRCAICGCEMENDWSKIHVDHIVPWELVGDELDNNYQDLCEKCNEEKNASTTYIFLKLIGLK